MGPESLHLKQGPNMVINLVLGENLGRSMALGVRKPRINILLHGCGYLEVGKLRLPHPQKRDAERDDNNSVCLF